MPKVSKKWWPRVLHWLEIEKPTASEYVTVAEIGHPTGTSSFRHLYTALVPKQKLQQILQHPGGIGHQVESTGLHRAPRFWIWSGEENEPLEPLVLAWESANTTVLELDPHFLMSYRLVPRYVPSTSTIHWDDLEQPRPNIAIVQPTSKYAFPTHTKASVQVLRSYLQDYASSRDMAVVQVYFAETWGRDNDDDLKVLGKNEIVQFKLPGRLIDLRRATYKDSTLLAQVWGVRRLLFPAKSPITDGRWDYGTLKWPGFAKSVTADSADRDYLMDDVFIRDEVLGEYEGRAEYQIGPESGSVSYGGQWGVGFCQRIGRDIISLELRKLYEGCRPEVVRHWHRYAVEPPRESISVLLRQPNVATRSKRIVHALIALGEGLASLASHLLRRTITTAQIVGLDRKRADAEGWWNEPEVAPITFHIPIALTESRFLDRCKSLNSLIAEGLGEKILRELASALGAKKREIKGLRALKLLDSVIRRIVLADRTGLQIRRDRQIISKRLLEESVLSPITPLFVLNELRISGSHRGSKVKIEDAATRLGISKPVHTSSLGFVLDDVYDRIGEALEEMSRLVKRW